MSVLTKDMPMPHSCMDCVMSNLECDWCILSKSKIPKEIRFENRLKQCPLVNVQPNKIITREQFSPIIEADESDMDSFIRIFEEDDEEDGMDSFIRILKD